VSEALNAGKSVYCESPLGKGLAEAVELARLANDPEATGSGEYSGDCVARSGIRPQDCRGWVRRRGSFGDAPMGD
jgi:hypothetical protein